MSAVFYRRGKSRPQVERAEEDCVDEIRDAKRIPDQERLTEAKPIIARYTRGNPGGGHRHGDITETGGPSEPARQKPLPIGHQNSQANESPAIQSDQKHGWNGNNQRAPAGEAHAHQEQQKRREEGDRQGYGPLVLAADERADRGQPIYCAKPQTSGACPGYRKDHIVPLACGDRDAVSNLQWQTASAFRQAPARGRDRSRQNPAWPANPCPSGVPIACRLTP
jgi:hypothetical protein